jgi:hypothetical protein
MPATAGDMVDIVKALRYADGELQAYAELEATGANTLSLVIRGLARIVKGIGLGHIGSSISKDIDELVSDVIRMDSAKAGEIASAEARYAEAMGKLDELEKKVSLWQSDGGCIPLAHTLSEINAQIGRRVKERDAAANVFELTASRREQFEEQIRELGQRMQDCQTSRDRKAIEQQRAACKEKLLAVDACLDLEREIALKLEKVIETLTIYRDAAELVRKGLPDDLFRNDPKK